MNGNWAERDERLVKLPEDDPEIFAIYINLVYTNTVATRRAEDPKTRDALPAELIRLSHLYVLSEKLCDTAAKNATIEATLASAEEKDTDGKTAIHGWRSIRTMYEGTPKGSPGRRLIVDLWTNSSFQTDYLEENEVHLPRDFFFDVMLALGKERQAAGNHVAKRYDASLYMEAVK
jgi:hypothetical protein